MNTLSLDRLKANLCIDLNFQRDTHFDLDPIKDFLIPLFRLYLILFVFTW